MKLITPNELAEWKQSGKEFQLIDVRETYEIANCSMGGYSIPMETIPGRMDEIRKDVPVVIHCQSGRRSEAVVHWIESKYEHNNLYSLQGGIMAWTELMASKEV